MLLLFTYALFDGTEIGDDPERHNGRYLRYFTEFSSFGSTLHWTNLDS